MPQRFYTIRITSAPPGEAPRWVREKWVGLELPTHQAAPAKYPCVGVLHGTRSWLGELRALLPGHKLTADVNGYAVDGEAAMRALEGVSPEAANWWRHDAPQHFGAGGYLIFHASACSRPY